MNSGRSWLVEIRSDRPPFRLLRLSSLCCAWIGSVACLISLFCGLVPERRATPRQGELFFLGHSVASVKGAKIAGSFPQLACPLYGFQVPRDSSPATLHERVVSICIENRRHCVLCHPLPWTPGRLLSYLLWEVGEYMCPHVWNHSDTPQQPHLWGHWTLAGAATKIWRAYWGRTQPLPPHPAKSLVACQIDILIQKEVMDEHSLLFNDLAFS